VRDELRDGLPRDAGHRDVEQHDVRVLLGDCAGGTDRVLSDDDVVSGGREPSSGHFKHDRIVVHDEDLETMTHGIVNPLGVPDSAHVTPQC